MPDEEVPRGRVNYLGAADRSTLLAESDVQTLLTNSGIVLALARIAARQIVGSKSH